MKTVLAFFPRLKDRSMVLSVFQNFAATPIAMPISDRIINDVEILCASGGVLICPFDASMIPPVTVLVKMHAPRSIAKMSAPEWGCSSPQI